MTAPRVQCPTSASWHGRHLVTDRRWTLTTPDGVETALCSLACVITWACHHVPATIEARSDFDLEPLTGSEAAA